MSEIAIFSKQDLEDFKADILNKVTTALKQNALSEFCTEDELMKKLDNPDPSTIWRWRKNGQLPEPIEIGNHKLYRISEIISVGRKGKRV